MTKSNTQYLGVMTSGSRTSRRLKKNNIIERNIVRKHRTTIEGSKKKENEIGGSRGDDPLLPPSPSRIDDVDVECDRTDRVTIMIDRHRTGPLDFDVNKKFGSQQRRRRR